MKRAHCPAVTATQAPPPNGKNVRTLRLAGPAAKAPPRRACGRRGRRGGCGTYLRLVKLLFSVCDFVSNDGPNVFDDHGVLLDVPSSIQAQSLGGNVRARTCHEDAAPPGTADLRSHPDGASKATRKLHLDSGDLSG